MSELFNYRAKVKKVIDADTVDLYVDLGFHVSVAIRTRLMGIDAPEVSTAEGRTARDWLRRLLPEGTAVGVSTYKDPNDKYGRWLARIDITDPVGAVYDLADMLVANGYAVRKVYPS